MSNTIFYNLGYTVGSTIKQVLGTKQYKTVTYDQQNGNDTADGVSEPTSNFSNVLYSVNKYTLTEAKFQNVSQSITYASLSQIDVSVTNFRAETQTEITFQLIDETSQVLGAIYLKNSIVTFSNFKFTIPDNVQPSSKLNTTYIFQCINSTVIFDNCEFNYLGSDSNYVYILSIGSSLTFNNCTFNNTQSTVVISPYTPSLAFANNVIPNNVIFKDDTISYWIQYSSPNSFSRLE